MFTPTKYTVNDGASLDDLQLKVLSDIKNYFTSDNVSKHKSFLVCMPMGAGKSYIIRLMGLYEDGPILILSHSSEVNKMLVAKLSAKIASLSLKNKKILSDITSPSDLTNDAVFILTYQKLHLLYKEETLYSQIAQKIKLVLADEGHREPSPQWSFAVRELKSPKILFSATPYRNDFNIFDIEEGATSGYSYHKILSEERNDRPILRSITPVELKADGGIAGVDEFLTKFEDHCAEPFKAIIRCSKSEDIRAVVKRINDTHGAVIAAGIHSNFTSTDDNNKNLFDHFSGNKLIGKNHRIFVHQNMLTEGVDDSLFLLVYFYDDYKSDRGIVQQIGRVLRYDKNKKAYLIANKDSRVLSVWKDYKDFDLALGDELKFWGIKDFSKSYLENLSKIIYGSNSFQEKFQMEPDPNHLIGDLRFDKSANIIVKYKYSKEQFERDVKSFNLDYADVQRLTVFRKSAIKSLPSGLDRFDDFYVICYMQLNPSKIFSRYFFPELEINFAAIFAHGDNLFIYSSKRRSHTELTNSHSLMNQDDLNAVIDKNAKFTYLSLNHLDVGDNSIRQRAVRAPNLQAVLTSNLDYSSYISSMLVNSKNLGRNYVGFSSGRMKKFESKDVDVTQYAKWIFEVAKKIKRKKDEPIFFKRFAKKVTPSAPLVPKYVLLDLYQIESFEGDLKSNFEYLDSMEFAMEASEIVVRGIPEPDVWSFTVKYKKKEYESLLKRDKYGRFRVELAKPYTDKIRETFSSLNSMHAFRVTFDVANIIYSSGKYLEIRNLSGISEILHSDSELNNNWTEKGMEALKDGKTHTVWKKSVFRHIESFEDRKSSLHIQLSGIDFLFCDDRGTKNPEVADFIALKNNGGERKIILIHCKSKLRKDGRRENTSATALYDITSQVVKNLRYLNPLNGKLIWPDTRFDNRTLSDKKYSGKYNVKRLSSFNSRPCDNEDFRNLYDELLADPRTIKESWMVICGGASKKELEDVLNGKVIGKNDYLYQAKYLIYSTWASCTAANCSLKVFCPPDKAK